MGRHGSYIVEGSYPTPVPHTSSQQIKSVGKARKTNTKARGKPLHTSSYDPLEYFPVEHEYVDIMRKSGRETVFREPWSSHTVDTASHHLNGYREVGNQFVHPASEARFPYIDARPPAWQEEGLASVEYGMRFNGGPPVGMMPPTAWNGRDIHSEQYHAEQVPGSHLKRDEPQVFFNNHHHEREAMAFLMQQEDFCRRRDMVERSYRRRQDMGAEVDVNQLAMRLDKYSLLDARRTALRNDNDVNSWARDVPLSQFPPVKPGSPEKMLSSSAEFYQSPSPRGVHDFTDNYNVNRTPLRSPSPPGKYENGLWLPHGRDEGYLNSSRRVNPMSPHQTPVECARAALPSQDEMDMFLSSVQYVC